MKHVRGELAEQLSGGLGPCAGRWRAGAEGQKVVADTIAHQTLRMVAGLNDRYTRASDRGGFGNVHQRRPRVQQLIGRAPLRIGEEADLRDVQQASPDCQRLETRGSHSRMKRFEKSSSQGRS